MKPLKALLLEIILAGITFSSGGQDKSVEDKSDLSLSNPFFTQSNLPYQAPPFDKIKDTDFKPALEKGMKMQLEEIQKIADNPEVPTFENTLVAMEKSGSLLDRVYNVFTLVTGANTNPGLQKTEQEIAPEMAAHNDAIFLNAKLFNRIQTIYTNRGKLKLDPESDRLVEVYYQNFELSGARLSDSDKAILKQLNEEEASLSATFTKHLLAATKAGALVVSDSSQLAGLAPGEAEAAARYAVTNHLHNKWLIALQNTTQQPALQSLSNRTTRQKLFEASWNRTEMNDSNDTRSIVLQLAKIHAEEARLIGFPNFATWKLQNQMAQSPRAVDDFFAKLVSPATSKAKAEAAGIQSFIDKQNGGFKLAPWDWNYYAEQLRKEKYNLDVNEIKPYFELYNVLENGVFYAAGQLYGLTFKARHDLPVYHPDVRVYEVFDGGSTLGLFYCDYFKRDNKSGGAWMNNLVQQTKLLGAKPVIYNVCNFTKPAAGQPALISYSDVTTMFHEFGHALHGFFANQKYKTLSGTNVARDFVEFPSQFNEHWALDPKVLKHYAVHYKTKEPMSQLLIDKIKKAGKFNSGYDLTEVLAAASLDMQWHKLSADTVVTDVDKFEDQALATTGLKLPEVPTRYRSSYFLHIWANGYAAGYYAYLWTAMLDEDAFAWFRANGGLSRANGKRFRDIILSRGNTRGYGKMYREFSGRNPDIRPMQLSRGLIPQ